MRRSYVGGRAVFSEYALPELRHHIAVLKMAVATGTALAFREARDRSNMIFFLEQTERLIEAASALQQKRRQRKGVGRRIPKKQAARKVAKTKKS